METPLNSPIHAKLHLLLIVWNRRVDLVQSHPNLGAHVPSQRRADHARAEMVVPRLRVAQRDGEILGYVVQQDQKRVFGLDVLLDAQDFVLKRPLVRVQFEVLRVSCAEELEDHLHEFFARQFGTR